MAIPPSRQVLPVGDGDGNIPELGIRFGPQGIVIEGVAVELAPFIAERLKALMIRRDVAQERLGQAQQLLEVYAQGVCDGMGLTADGNNANIDLDTMTYRILPKKE
mgnify:CR=1 FL=1